MTGVGPNITVYIVLGQIVALMLLILLIVLSWKFKTFGKIIGAIFFVGGIFALVFGLYILNSWTFQISYPDNFEDIMTVCLAAGGISTVLGIILFVLGISGKKTPVVNVNVPAKDNASVTIVKIRCPKCQALNDEFSKFCTNCGNTITNNNM